MEFYQDLSEAMEAFSKHGAFLTVRNADGTTNTMTIGWGFIGFTWRKPYFITMVRQQRYTREVLKTAADFTISIPFGKDRAKELAICGSKSGWDVNKEEAANLLYLPGKTAVSPIVDGCDLYYECKIAYTETLEVERLPKEAQGLYDGDTHDLFYGEIVEVYK